MLWDGQMTSFLQPFGRAWTASWTPWSTFWRPLAIRLSAERLAMLQRWFHITSWLQWGFACHIWVQVVVGSYNSITRPPSALMLEHRCFFFFRSTVYIVTTAKTLRRLRTPLDDAPRRGPGKTLPTPPRRGRCWFRRSAPGPEVRPIAPPRRPAPRPVEVAPEAAGGAWRVGCEVRGDERACGLTKLGQKRGVNSTGTQGE